MQHIDLAGVDDDRSGDGPDQHAHVPVTRGTCGQGGTEDHLGFQPTDGSHDHAGDVDVGCLENASVDERRKSRDLRAEEGTKPGHTEVPVPPSRSLSPVTRAGGTRQLNTPYGLPATTGVPAPAMPRTNRYAAPPRCRAGS